MATTAWGTAATASGNYGYYYSTLRSYLTGTVLTRVNTDMTALGFNVIERKCLEGTSINVSGYNRFGTATGCTNNWAWYDEKIIALSEPNIYGASIASSSFYDVGDGFRQLNCFKNYNLSVIADMKYLWLRERSSASYACRACGDIGNAVGNDGVAYANAAFGLIIIN